MAVVGFVVVLRVRYVSGLLGGGSISWFYCCVCGDCYLLVALRVWACLHAVMLLRV